jgi:hypothetical protein
MNSSDIIALASIIPQILFGIAILVAVIRGNVNVSQLTKLVDGKFTEMLKLVSDTKKMEGQVETLKEVVTKPATTIITDRRKTEES